MPRLLARVNLNCNSAKANPIRHTHAHALIRVTRVYLFAFRAHFSTVAKAICRVCVCVCAPYPEINSTFGRHSALFPLLLFLCLPCPVVGISVLHAVISLSVTLPFTKSLHKAKEKTFRPRFLFTSFS